MTLPDHLTDITGWHKISPEMSPYNKIISHCLKTFSNLGTFDINHVFTHKIQCSMNITYSIFCHESRLLWKFLFVYRPLYHYCVWGHDDIKLQRSECLGKVAKQWEEDYEDDLLAEYLLRISTLSIQQWPALWRSTSAEREIVSGPLQTCFLIPYWTHFTLTLTENTMCEQLWQPRGMAWARNMKWLPTGKV